MKGKEIKFRKEVVNLHHETISLTPFKYSAVFCEFGVQAFATDLGIAQTTMAIVMLQGGELKMVHPEHIKFV